MGEIWAHFNDVVSLAALVIAWCVMRYGSGQANTQFQQKVEFALQKFSLLLDEKLDVKFREYVPQGLFELRLKLIETTIARDKDMMTLGLEQLNHRLSRDAQHIGMLIDVMLRAGMHVKRDGEIVEST